MGRYEGWDYVVTGAPATERRKAPTQFVIKTYQLVDDPDTDTIVSWGDERISTFIVWRPTEFARDILPNYFRHNNFSSFVRQLNGYGFRKVVQERWEFGHAFFQKGRQQLLGNVHRGATAAEMAWPPLNFATAVHCLHPVAPLSTVLPALADGVPSRCTSNTAELVEENERLQQSNTALQRELVRMRKLYSDIVYFVQSSAHKEPGLQSSAHKETALLVSVAACNHNCRSTTLCSSVSIAEKPSAAGPQRETNDNYDGGRGTARASTTILFGVRLTAPTTIESRPKRAPGEEEAKPLNLAHGRKRRIVT